MTFLLITFAALAFGERIFGKLCSAAINGESRASYGYYYVTHSLLACVFFLLSGGFSFNLNLYTLLYSVALAAAILLNMLTSLLMLRCMNILGSGILATPLTLLLTALSGVIIWSESLTISVYLKIIITTASAFFIFLDIGGHRVKFESRKNDDTVNVKRYLPLMLASVLLTVLQTVITKAFATSDRVTDEHSFYLMTNVIMLGFGFVLLFTSGGKGRGSFRAGFSFFKPGKVLSTVGNVVVSNLKSLVTLPLIEMLDVSLFSPINSALGIVVGVLVSLLFKERLGIFSYIAAAVAIVAIFV